jgi:hypothetical protein
MRLLLEAKGEDALPAVAGIAVEMDAVARAARQYGLFRGCGSGMLAAPDCTPQLKVGDGPNPKATAGRCVDTIMVTNFR